MCDDLVDRIVSPDVLAHTLQVTAGIEEAGGVQAPRFGEERLFFAEPLRNRPNGARINPGNPLRDRMTSREANRLEGCLPAHPARGLHVEMADQAVNPKSNSRAQQRPNDVAFMDDGKAGPECNS